MSLDPFWDVIDAQIVALESAKTADDVIEILSTDKNPYGDPTISGSLGFFAGSGGDKTVAGALQQAGWSIRAKASYWYFAIAPDRLSAIEYIEGDIDRVDLF